MPKPLVRSTEPRYQRGILLGTEAKFIVLFFITSWRVGMGGDCCICVLIVHQLIDIYNCPVSERLVM